MSAVAPGLPRQPLGLRLPTVQCELTVPQALTRSASPMPDHVAEFLSNETPPKVSVIVADRVETALTPAIERVRAFHRSGLLTSPGATVSTDEALEGAVAPGQSMNVRWGTEGQQKIESVTLLAFEGLPIVEVVARYDDADAVAKASVQALVRSLRCSKK